MDIVRYIFLSCVLCKKSFIFAFFPAQVSLCVSSSIHVHILPLYFVYKIILITLTFSMSAVLQRVDFEQANHKVHAKLSGRKLESNRPLVKSA